MVVPRFRPPADRLGFGPAAYRALGQREIVPASGEAGFHAHESGVKSRAVNHAARLSGSASTGRSPSSGAKDNIQSAALLAWLAARTTARESSRSTSSQEPI